MMTDHARAHAARTACHGLLLMIALTIAATVPLPAQRWMETFGGTNPTGERGDGVTECANGDIVAVGSSLSATGTPRAYVVRTDAHGVLLWDFVYDVAGTGNSAGYDIKECANGDLIVAGATGPAASRLAFAMRLTSAGGYIWATAVRTTLPNNGATSILETTWGDNVTTFAGDIVIGGITQSPAVGVSDGMIARFTSAGALVWCKSYDVRNPGSYYDVLTSIDETQIPSITGSVGDIVAVGFTSATPTSQQDIWLLRVGGATGTIGAAPQGSALYGTPGLQTDAGYAIQELRNGAHNGDLAVAGITRGRPAPSTNDEAIVVQFLADPCNAASPRAARFLGDNGTRRDAASCLREITSASVGTLGNIVVGGGQNPGWLGGFDGFIQEFQEGTLAPLWLYYYYGGTGDDILPALAQVSHAPNSQGFVFTGRTTSAGLIPVGNTQNLWLAKVDAQFNNDCAYERRTETDAAATLARTCATILVLNVVPPSSATGPSTSPTWNRYLVCYVAAKTATGASSEDAEARVATLDAYPSPIGRGGGITLAYTLTAPGMVHLSVIDLLGRTMFENESPRGVGHTTTLVPTTGWGAGTYLVRAVVGGKAVSTRIVVTTR